MCAISFTTPFKLSDFQMNSHCVILILIFVRVIRGLETNTGEIKVSSL
jgi:hypothetical protein